MKYLVFGLGVSGTSVAKYLLSIGEDVIGVDHKVRDVPGLRVFDESVCLDGVDCIVLSPGIPRTHPLIRRAKNIEVVSEVEFAFKQLKNRCIGITGSNGKTSATLLIAHVLNENGTRAKAVGNVGTPLSASLLEKNNDVLVVELSSFQLEQLNRKCLDFAAILNITENHLDRYLSMNEYVKAKLNIETCLKPGGRLFITAEIENEYGVSGIASPNIPFAICQQFGITEAGFDRAVKTFKKPPHRLEFIGKKEGVFLYNDSKSTSIASTLYAVDRLKGPLILIVGGVDKGSSYKPWVEHFRKKVKHVVAYGKAKEKIAKELEGTALTKVDLFADAVKVALLKAKESDTVLLSPGCSSYDQFDNFEQRGDTFRELVLEGTWIEKKQS